MIVFDLRCSGAHVFEAWFRSSADYEEQRGKGLVSCPVCADTTIDKAVMAPHVGAKGNRRRQTLPASSTAQSTPPAVADPATPSAPPREMLAALAAVQARLLEKSEWVGPRFADRARAMHLGEEPATLIHGQASLADARALVEEGVPVAPLLVPVVPPEALN